MLNTESGNPQKIVNKIIMGRNLNQSNAGLTNSHAIKTWID